MADQDRNGDHHPGGRDDDGSISRDQLLDRIEDAKARVTAIAPVLEKRPDRMALKRVADTLGEVRGRVRDDGDRIWRLRARLEAAAGDPVVVPPEDGTGELQTYQISVGLAQAMTVHATSPEIAVAKAQQLVDITKLAFSAALVEPEPEA